jgi:K(+)-stimulated pyrophosphate-energized sodium pump
MIKVVNLVSLIAAPVIVQYEDLGIGGWVIVAVLLVGLVWGIFQSKKPAPELQAAASAPGD